MPDNYMTLDEMNSIEFDSTHLWHINFPGAPDPFNKWFPAQSCDDDIYNLKSDSFDVGYTDIEIPTGEASKNIHLECLDAADCRLEKWLDAWVHGTVIVDGGDGAIGPNYLDKMCKKLNIIKNDYQLNPVYKKQYIVVPSGSLKANRTADPNIKVLSFDLKIYSVRNL